MKYIPQNSIWLVVYFIADNNTCLCESKQNFTQVPAGRLFERCPEYEQWKAVFYKAGYAPHNPGDHMIYVCYPRQELKCLSYGTIPTFSHFSYLRASRP